MKNLSQKIIVIAGPTASGKSDLAIALAKKYDGEVISADSRQVYRGMDIGTGKVPRDFTEIPNTQYLIPNKNSKNTFYLSEGIRHHLIDIASPKRSYNVSHFVRDAEKAIADIRKRGKVPIICGGTHFWIEALLAGTTLPAVKPNPVLRKKLGQLSLEMLFAMLEKKDPARAETIDKHNKIRLIRALEICEALGSVPPLCHPGLDPGSRKKTLDSRLRENDKAIIIALVPDKEILHKRIAKRLEKRLAEGMIEEVETLRASGLSWKRLESFGLEYRYVALFLQGKLSREEMTVELETEIRQYAKRQLTFLRRMERSGLQIHWISHPKEAKSIVSKM